jgi:hypothetical protein
VTDPSPVRSRVVRPVEDECGRPSRHAFPDQLGALRRAAIGRLATARLAELLQRAVADLLTPVRQM